MYFSFLTKWLVRAASQKGDLVNRILLLTRRFHPTEASQREPLELLQKWTILTVHGSVYGFVHAIQLDPTFGLVRVHLDRHQETQQETSADQRRVKTWLHQRITTRYRWIWGALMR